MSPHDASADLEKLAQDYWAALMERFPVWATSLAVHDHDDSLTDMSPEALDAWLARIAGFLERARAIDVEGLDAKRQVTLGMLSADLETSLDVGGLRTELWAVDQLAGPQVSFLELPRIQRVTDATSAAAFLARVRAMPELLRQQATNLAAGLAEGRVAARCNVVRVLEQLDDAITAGAAGNALTQVADGPRPATMDDDEWQRFRARLVDAVEGGLLPAFVDYRAFLRDEILPAARDQPGLHALPGGDAAYRACIRWHVSLDLDPREIHQTGLDEVERLRGEMEALTAELLPGRSLAEALAELRENPELSFSSREEIVESAQAAVRRATEAASRCFELLPSHECAVAPIDRHAEKSSPAAYYLPPAPDGSRPGTYFVNTHDPSSRPRYEAEVVAFHEAVPGHHLQLAIAQALPDLPDFQRHSHCTAYVEGWALYTERLADELGLFTGPMDRLGMYSCDTWRAARLVVDTGLHALGWSRQQAIDYMVENTAASLLDIANEVDRYVAWPGQALAYKLGQLEILRLRRKAEEALGARFDLKDFHRVVLADGGITLPLLGRQVEAWLAQAGGA